MPISQTRRRHESKKEANKKSGKNKTLNKVVEISPNILMITINENKWNTWNSKNYIKKIQPYFMYLKYNGTQKLARKGLKKR